MATSVTPGTVAYGWRVEKVKGGPTYVNVAGLDARICTMNGTAGDAKLIAAAPAMLAALVNIIEGKVDRAKAIDAARHAVQQAEGR